jgi:hypothetical protein
MDGDSEQFDPSLSGVRRRHARMIVQVVVRGKRTGDSFRMVLAGNVMEERRV